MLDQSAWILFDDAEVARGNIKIFSHLQSQNKSARVTDHSRELDPTS